MWYLALDEIQKNADNTKFYGVVANQWDLREIKKWLQDFMQLVCRLTYIVDKYKVMYHVQRVSAMHGVKDDFAFLWEHAIFRHPPNKNPLTDRSEILHS
jgi:hypothetical protein